MTTTYYYYVGNPPNIVTLVATLNTKITADLELPFNIYVSTIYNNTTETIEITYSSPLSKHFANILNNLANIILFGEIVGSDVYVTDNNSFNRRSLGVTSAPTINTDDLSGYSVGSVIITTNDVIYTCTNNTTGNAKWVITNNILNKTLPYVTTFNNSNGTGLESSNNIWTIFNYYVYKGTNLDSAISSVLFVAYTSRSTSWYRFRLRNVANSSILGTSTQSNVGSQSSPETITISTITNLPATQTLLAFELLSTNSTGNTGVSSRSTIGIYTIQVIG